MRKTVIVYGIISGIIIATLSLLMWSNMGTDFENGMLLGYTSMLLAMTLVFFGVKSLRDKTLNGNITFGKAFTSALLIALVSSIFYVSSWEVYSSRGNTRAEFMQKYCDNYIKKMKEKGATEQEIATQKAEMKAFNEMYENFFIRIGFSFLEILPVGLLVSLATALILKTKRKTQVFA